jgi:hypothetical protein
MTAVNTKLKIRADYELGNIASIEKLSAKWRIPKRTIERWIDKESWVKNEKKDLVAKSIQQRFVEALANEGCDVVYLAKKVKELMEASDCLIIDGKPIAGITEKNWAAMAKGLQEANKILGAYAPVKTEIEVKIKGVFAQFVDVAIKYVPENKRVECASELNDVARGIE